jgi:hypothetical protein
MFGTARSGLGFARNRRKQGLASQRAQRLAVWRRGVAAAITYSHRGVITPIPNETSLGFTR